MTVNISKLKPYDKIVIIRKCQGFTPTQRLILYTIATHLGNNYFCFLSLTTLQNETGLSRSAISDNLKILIEVDVVRKMAPGEGYKSNRYAINFQLLVVLDYQCSSLGLLDYTARTTRLVVQDYPKRNINKVKESERDDPFNFFDKKSAKEKAIEDIRKLTKTMRTTS